MTEPTQSQIAGGTVKKKRGLFVPITIGVLALILVGFVVSRAGLDKVLVKQQLDDFIVQMKEKARAQGRDLDMTYGDLEVVGSFASKHVVIHNPALTVKPLERAPQQPGSVKHIDALVITTPTIEVYPQAKDLSSLRLQLPDPLNFAGEEDPEKSLLKVTNNVPMVVTMSRKLMADVNYNEVSYQSPTQIELTYLREEQAKGEEEKTPTIVPVYDTTSLAVAQGSGITSSLANDKSGLGEVKIFFRDLRLTPKDAPEAAVKISEISGNWSNNLNDKKLNVVKAMLKVGPVTSDKKDMQYLPASFDMDATYEGAMPKTPEAIASVGAPESSMVLKNFSLIMKDASVSAMADFKANASDMLPVGTAKLELKNVAFILAELRKYGVVTPGNEAVVAAVLKQMTGTPVEQLRDVVIPIDRARGGAFKIGQSTFEELLAVMIKQAMAGKSVPATGSVPTVDGNAPKPGLVPQLPPADKPKSAPIAVPDPSVRG